MDKIFFDKEVETSLDILKDGGTILYPTDTIWGIGCDATNEEAVRKVYRIKEREDSKSLIILVAEERDVLQYVAAPDLGVFNFIADQKKPTTIIFENAVGLPPNLIATDGSIAIRLVKDEFCRHLIKRLRSPIVSTSANISSQPSPNNFKEVSNEIKERVDYVVKWRQEEAEAAQPSQIIKWNSDGSYTIIRA